VGGITMQKAYLVFDIGTGNTRVSLVSESGEILDIAKENTKMYMSVSKKPMAL